MKTEAASGALGRIEITCGNCAWNDNGICDKLGYVVEDDDKPVCGAEWERKENA